MKKKYGQTLTDFSRLDDWGDLLIVIYLGKFLITLVNKYAPEEVAPAKQETPRGPAPIPGNILAAITAAVNVVTQGKGKVTKVEKL